MILEKQDGKNIYSDGQVAEAEMLEIAKAHPEPFCSQAIEQDSRYVVNNTFSSVRHNLFNWYPFKEHCSILEVGAGMGALTGLFCRVADSVTAIEMNRMRAEVIRSRLPEAKNLNVLCQDIFTWDESAVFDYVVVSGVLEYAAIFCQSDKPFHDFLQALKRHLKSDGILLLAIENRFGLRYFCGAAEDHTEILFGSLNDFAGKQSARTFSRSALEKLLKESGFPNQRTYGVMPDYRFPTLIFSNEWPPSVRDLDSVLLTYGRKSLLVADEKALWPEIQANNVTNFFANSLLIEVSGDNLPKESVLYVKSRGEVKPEFRIITRIFSNGVVEKVPVNMAAREHIRQIARIMEHLSMRGIRCIDYHLTTDCTLRSNLVDLPDAQDIFVDAIQRGDKKTACLMLSQLRSAIEQSSEVTLEPCNELLCAGGVAQGYGRILAHGYVDMTFYNAFWDNDNLLFYDQEWDIPNVPMKFLLYYSIKSAYRDCGQGVSIPLEEILTHEGIDLSWAPDFDAFEQKIFDCTFLRRGNVYGEDGLYNDADKTCHLGEYTQLQVDFDALALAHKQLEEVYFAHEDQRKKLQSDFDVLAVAHRQLEEVYFAQKDLHKKLQSDFDTLAATYKQLKEDSEAFKAEFCHLRSYRMINRLFQWKDGSWHFLKK